MKKNFITLLITLPLLAFSQPRLGVCLNPTLGWFSENVSGLEKDVPGLGLEGGLLFEYYFQKNYAFNTGLKLGNFTGSVNYTEPVTVNSVILTNIVKYKMQYISVPLGLKLKTNEIGYYSYYAVLGFTPQINIGAKADINNSPDFVDIQKGVALMNLSYHFGGGVEYSLGGNTALNLGVIFNNGFMDVLSKQGEKEKYSYLTLQLGIMF